MKNLRSLFTAALISALAFTAAPARAADESPFKFEFHGFVTGSMYLQDQQFGVQQGQGLLLYAPSPLNNAPYKGDAAVPPANAATKSGTYLTSDIRQSRFIFATTGPKAFGATPKAYIEGDFLGGTGSALFWESWTPRLRSAYAELNWGNTVFQAGQFSAHLLLGQIPNSVAHIANPPTFGAGTVGWRTMGFRILETIPMDAWKLELAAEVVHSRWGTDPSPFGTPNNTPAVVGLGAASDLPQVVGRVKGYGKSGDFDWTVYVAASYESINFKGFGDVHPNGVTLADGTVKTSASPYVAEVGGLLKYDIVSLAFNVYTGSGTAAMAGALLQNGMIGDTGYWAQLGINATKEFSIWGLFGGETLNKTDMTNWAAVYPNAAPKSDNQLFGGQLRYQDAGYAFALEYYRYATKYLATPARGGAADYGDTTTNASQFILTAGYFF